MAYATFNKLERIDALRKRRDLDEIWFLRPTNFSWVTAGDAIVDATSDVGVAAIGFDDEGIHLLVPNNERDRICEEELPALDAVDVAVSTMEYRWDAHSLRSAVAEHRTGAAATDVPVEGLPTVDPIPLRSPLATAAERERFREACADVTKAVETVARDLTAKTTEREAGAALAEALLRRGFTVPVLLIGGGSRAFRHRHFTVTDAPLDGFAHLTVVAVRGGHNVAVTRTVAFDPPSWLRERHDTACRVAATAVAATQEAGQDGGTAGDVFDAITDAYTTLGFDNEWTEHHQGGAIAYGTREWTATLDSDIPIKLPMPYAWNPTVQGAKCENTVLVTDDAIENATTTGEWPTTEYDAVGLDDSVVFHDPLSLS